MGSKKFLSVVAAIAFAAVGGSVVRADAVTATFNSVSNEKDIHFHLDGLGDEYVAVGNYMWSGQAANPVGLQGSFATFCIDFQQDIGYGGTYGYNLSALNAAPVGGNNPVGGMGADRAQAIEELWGLHYGDLGSDADKIAGFQMAIWELINEEQGAQTLDPLGLSLESGAFYATDLGTATDIADAYLQSLFSNGTLRNDALATGLVALTSESAQDQLVQLSGPQFATVPAPLPSSAAAGFGLLWLAGYGAMRARRKSVVA